MSLTLTSPAFDDGARIPDQHGYTRDNISPPLRISGVPDAAASLVLVMDDPDAVEPAGKVWDHWILYNVPPDTAAIEEGAAPDEAVAGTNDYGERGYGGPNPPDREHTYRFRLYAVDTQLDIDAGATKETVLDAVEDHVIAEASLTGTFAP